MTPTVELLRVRKSYGGFTAVDDLSFEIPPAHIFGLLGPNGAGKTSTIRMMIGIIAPDSGCVRIFGEPFRRRVLRRVGYLPEERGLYRRMTVGDNLIFLGRLAGLSVATSRERIGAWARRLEIADWIDRRVEELSKGMQQKIQFIAALLHDPGLIVMDEPFAGLDPLNLDLVKDTILRLRAAGKTIILSTHIMEQAETLCDRILLIHRGEKVLDGSLDEIRAPYESDAVVVELDGESGFIESLPMVRGVTRSERRITIELREKGRDQELLAAHVGKVRVRAFEIKTPSLHEIFVRVVRGRHE